MKCEEDVEYRCHVDLEGKQTGWILLEFCMIEMIDGRGNESDHNGAIQKIEVHVIGHHLSWRIVDFPENLFKYMCLHLMITTLASSH